MTAASEQEIELNKAAHDLMDGSDYLTEMVQRFCVTCKTQYMDNYFAEAFQAKRRDHAIEQMSQGEGPAAESALKDLERAMDDSQRLMSREYYAMRLIVDAKGYTDYPDVLDQVHINQVDDALEPADKIDLAQEMVHDEQYYSEKDLIRQNMTSAIEKLEDSALKVDQEAKGTLSVQMTVVRLVIILQTVGIFIMVWLSSHIAIYPILNAVGRIKENRTLSEEDGANEFRYLAHAYNKMYEVYQDSLESLSFKASHDELTGAYNRAGYDLLLSSVDLKSTCMLLFDIDNFKFFNDNYGHDMGDKVLVTVVETLRSYFRSDDLICRIGGDEFVVFMVHVPIMRQELVSNKVEQINDNLKHPQNGMPPISLSIGIAHGSDAENAEDLFEKADKAMYRAKLAGKGTYALSE
jgi:diguanylate cyclase (GGDEF)-like protein